MWLLFEEVRICHHPYKYSVQLKIISFQLRFRFGASALKCRSCSIFLHPDCKLQFAMACIPKSQGTPNLKNGKQGHITDYVSAESPMLPPLVVHCVNEVCLMSNRSNHFFVNQIQLFYCQG